MGNTNFSSFLENMAFWSLKPYSDINVYLISKLWQFGIMSAPTFEKIFTRKLKMSRFLHNVQLNVQFFKYHKILYNFLGLGLLSECFISTPKPLIPSKPHVSDTKQ